MRKVGISSMMHLEKLVELQMVATKPISLHGTSNCHQCKQFTICSPALKYSPGEYLLSDLEDS